MNEWHRHLFDDKMPVIVHAFGDYVFTTNDINFLPTMMEWFYSSMKSRLPELMSS